MSKLLFIYIHIYIYYYLFKDKLKTSVASNMSANTLAPTPGELTPYIINERQQKELKDKHAIVISAHGCSPGIYTYNIYIYISK